MVKSITEWLTDFGPHLESFCEWVIAYPNRKANAFTLITVILSGFISWGISALYFQKGNRANLSVSMLYPMKLLLEEPCSWKNYNNLEQLSKSYCSRYLRKAERDKIVNLLGAYKTICSYHYDQVCAQSLFSYFDYKLRQKGIDTKPKPLYIDDELIDYDYPDELFYMRDELAQMVEKYPPESNNAEDCRDGVIKIFNAFAKAHYTDDPISYFDDYSFDDVLKKAQISRKWDEEFSVYRAAKAEFLSMKVFGKNK